MTLNRYKLGDLLEQSDERNSENKYSVEDVRGISTGKAFIETKANMNGVSLTSYKIVKNGEFAYVADTSRRGDKIALAFNNNDKIILISSIYTVFKVKRKDILDSKYLFIYFNRPEFDRFSRFNSWGSARETFSWEDFCDTEIKLPSIDIQQKYVDIYNAMLANQQSYERGLDDFKLTCDLYIENLRRKIKCEKIGPFIEEKFEKNENNKIKLFQGVTVDHIFTDPKRVADDSENGNIVRTGQFAFNKVMKANRTKMPIALREGPDCVVSNSYQVFEVINKEKLLSEYLMLWLNRTETQRYCGFISFGTTRDIFTFDDMKEISIPIPSLQIQKDIVNIYNVYNERKAINEKLKKQIKDLCPILIKGSIEESMKES